VAPHPQILAAATALPPHFATQEELIAAFRRRWEKHHFNLDRLDQLFHSVRVGGRHLALPLEAYERLGGFGARNDAWLRSAAELAERAAREALERAGVAPEQVHHVYFTSVTGISAPSVDALLVNRLHMREDVKRTPLFGLGCVAGAAGIARAADALRAFPGEIALLVSVELCSLTLQLEDASVANVIAAGLFGDGCAAVVLGGGERPGRGPRIPATRSVFYPDTERVMGWDVIDTGFRVVLSPRVPELARGRIRGDVDRFLAAQGLSREEVRHWLCHPGGPRVIEAFEEALELPAGALDRTRRSLAEVGNLSSASVLFVLASALEDGAGRQGERGMLIAMGPGFGSGRVVLPW
jgi:alkylresorcinol/alkylpyrone synthase